MKKLICWGILPFAFCFLIFALVYGSATTTNTVSTNSYYGRESTVKILTFTVVPVAADDNSIYTSVTSSENIWGELRQISISATGTDTAFTVNLKDQDGIALYTKSDCSTATLPARYNLSATTNPGQLVASALTLDVNSVDPNNLTGVTVKVYYSDFRN